MNRTLKRILAGMLACASLLGLTGCSVYEEEETVTEVDFSEIGTICELATLKCYFHNVARIESEASGLFQFLGVGYKKVWIEYSGIVELGIDVNQVEISQPDENGVLTITIPDAEILNVYLDEETIGEPLTDTGFLTSVTTEEETLALSTAQDDMEALVAADTSLLNQAKERAKDVIEGYVTNVGEVAGVEYTIEWVDAE